MTIRPYTKSEFNEGNLYDLDHDRVEATIEQGYHDGPGELELADWARPLMRAAYSRPLEHLHTALQVASEFDVVVICSLMERNGATNLRVEAEFVHPNGVQSDRYIVFEGAPDDGNAAYSLVEFLWRMENDQDSLDRLPRA